MQKENDRAKACMFMSFELRKSINRLLDKFETKTVLSAISQAIDNDFGIGGNVVHNHVPSSPVPPRLRASFTDDQIGVYRKCLKQANNTPFLDINSSVS